MFIFIGICQAVFSHSHPQSMHFPLFSASSPAIHIVVGIWTLYVPICAVQDLFMVIICIFLMAHDAEYLHVFIFHFYVLFGKVPILIFDHFKIRLYVFLLLNFESLLYVLCANIFFFLPNIWLKHIFSHSVACFFLNFFLIVYFIKQKILILIKSYLSAFLFYRMYLVLHLRTPW